MQKLLIYCALGASLIITGCETMKEWGAAVGDTVPNAFDKMPLMHRADVQQGNIVTQEMINQLKPGMARRQIRYIMGTPILVDVFHQNRWDYIYSMKPGSGTRDQKRISLFFEDDKLVRIEGDFRPDAPDEQLIERRETIVSVPDYDGGEKGFFTRALEKVGIKSKED